MHGCCAKALDIERSAVHMCLKNVQLQFVVQVILEQLRVRALRRVACFGQPPTELRHA